MNKLFIYLLLLTTFSTGVAYALDVHPESIAGHDITLSDELIHNDDHDHSEDGRHHNDHSCHSAAHLVGIVFDQIAPFTASSRDDFLALSQTPKILYLAPLLRPPIA